MTAPDTAPADQPGLRDLFRHADFVRLVCGRAALTLGSLAQTVALGWLVYSISGDPLHLGLVGLAEFLPACLLALPAGQLVDRMDRRLLLSLATLADALAASLLLTFVLTGLDNVWPVFAIALLTGGSRAFAFPAAQALLPNTVPTALLPNAIAFGSSTFQVAAIAGPAVGGLLYALGAEVVFATALGLFLLTSTLTFGIRAQRGQQSQREPATWATVLAGLSFIRRRPIVLGAISLDLFAVLFGGATALLPIFAGEILHVGPLGLGLLRSAPAVGAALMAIYLSWRPMRDRVGARLFAAVAVFGLATIVFGLSTTFWLSFAALLVLGAADEISVFVRLTLIQLATPDEMRGRVAAVNSVFIGASNQLGEFESGVTAALMGVVPAVIFGGCGTLAVTLLWMRWFPALARIRRFEELKRTEGLNMRVAIYGAGAIGTSIGGRLAEGGLDVTFIARGAQLEALSRHGLDLTVDGRRRRLPVRAAAPGSALPPQDAVLIATKAVALPDIAAAAAGLVGRDGVIVPAINGVPWWLSGTRLGARLGGPLRTLDPTGHLAATVPHEAILGCGVYLPATLTGPGSVVSPRAGFLALGEPEGGPSERAGHMAAAFTAAGMPTRAEPDVVSRIWAKLLTNMAFSPLAALTGAPAGPLALDPDIRPVLAEIMEEGLAIARALGLEVTERVADLIDLSASAGRHKPSLLKDVEAGRPTEMEHILGAPVEIAGRLGVPVPVCARIHALARVKLRELGLA